MIITTLGIVCLVFLNIFFEKLIDKLDQRTDNLKAKISIGDYIVNDLYKIRSDFYELATTVTNKRGRNLVLKKIQDRIETIRESLYVLEHGGTLNKIIQLNIEGHNKVRKTITFVKSNKDDISLEAIDLYPKLVEFEIMIEKLTNLLKQREEFRKQTNSKEYLHLAKEIKRFYKATPSFFIRIIENSSRLLYEGENHLALIQTQIENEKIYYKQLELLLIFAIILITLTLGYLISKQINKNNKKLLKLNEQFSNQEKSTRAILDAQVNIVVVSNGEEMIDANSALVSFFDGYNSFDDFKLKHACICDYFIDMNSEEYVIDKDYPEGMWYEHILAYPNQFFKVVMMQGEKKHHFSITAQKKEIDYDTFIIIISLNDITSELTANKELKRVNDNLEDIVKAKTKELQNLNDNLEIKIEKELASNRAKDKKMIEQSRYAALGEMIGNIAHQWRQPLSAISSTSSGVQLQMDLKLAKEEDIYKSYTDIMSYVTFLTQTIEDFRSFFKKDREEVKFNMLEILNNTINITNAAYKDENIKIVYDLQEEELQCKGFPNELAQAFLNILNNSRDALLANKITKKIVKISTYQQNNSNIIEICDNAGGISPSIINKVFDPYFTTKHQSQGTGIGLYMTKDIIEKHMKGSITIKNKQYKNNNITFNGACFTITLPKVNE